MFHVDIDLTCDWNDERKDYLKKIFKKKKELKLITFQATKCCSKELIAKKIFQLYGKAYNRYEMLENANLNIKWLRTVLNREVAIGLENNNYYPSSAYDIITEGDFISEIVNQNNIFLLLDIAHAKVTAHYKQLIYDNYLDSLPLDKTIQLHICKPNIPGKGMAFDVHEAPNDQMFQEVLNLTKKYKKIKYLTIEYYKDKNVLIESILKLRNILKK